MLKDIVDETSLGKYDFMYLRIGKKTCSSCTRQIDHTETPRFRQQLQVSFTLRLGVYIYRIVLSKTASATPLSTLRM